MQFDTEAFHSSSSSTSYGFGSEDFLQLLLSRFDGAAAAGEHEHALLSRTLHWVYASQPSQRATLRLWLGQKLMHFGKNPNNSLAVGPLLDVTAQIVRGFKRASSDTALSPLSSSSLDAAHRQLLHCVILPLHNPSTFFEWRDQLPLLQTYHTSLVFCILQFLGRDSSLLSSVSPSVRPSVRLSSS